MLQCVSEPVRQLQQHLRYFGFIDTSMPLEDSIYLHLGCL